MAVATDPLAPSPTAFPQITVDSQSCIIQLKENTVVPLMHISNRHHELWIIVSQIILASVVERVVHNALS